MIEVQLEGCIYKLNFGYNAKMGVYANSSSDILTLGEILVGDLSKQKENSHV